MTGPEGTSETIPFPQNGHIRKTICAFENDEVRVTLVPLASADYKTVISITSEPSGDEPAWFRPAFASEWQQAAVALAEYATRPYTMRAPWGLQP